MGNHKNIGIYTEHVTQNVLELDFWRKQDIVYFDGGHFEYGHRQVRVVDPNLFDGIHICCLRSKKTWSHTVLRSGGGGGHDRHIWPIDQARTEIAACSHIRCTSVQRSVDKRKASFCTLKTS